MMCIGIGNINVQATCATLEHRILVKCVRTFRNRSAGHHLGVTFLVECVCVCFWVLGWLVVWCV